MRGASKGVQARILKLNPVALFTHCLTQHVTPQRLMYEIFSALSKSCIHTFVEGSADRHAYFIKTQREYNNDEVPLHLVGLMTAIRAGIAAQIHCDVCPKRKFCKL